MPENQLPCHAFLRSVSVLYNQYKDYIRAILKTYNTFSSQLEKLVGDWASSLHVRMDAVQTAEAKLIQEAEEYHRKCQM